MPGPAADAVQAGLAAPSPWVCRWAPLIRPGGRVLDLACGSGRHVRWLAARGFAVTGVDRDGAALEALRAVAQARMQLQLQLQLQVADLEAAPWPLPGQRFDAVIVTNYLWRPLWPDLLAALDAGGVLIYETFAEGNQSVGKPSRADFLLRHGELLELAHSLRIVAYEDGFLEAPQRFVQRIAAVAAVADAAADRRYPLQAGPAPGA